MAETDWQADTTGPMVERVAELVDTYGLDDEQADAVAWLELAHQAVVRKDAQRDRAARTVHALNEDVGVTTIAQALGVTRATVYGWEAAYGD